jgi:hypothetical protein
MLKKILILALALHVPCIRSSQPSSRPENFSLGTSLALAVPGLICARLWYKKVSEQMNANAEITEQLNNLRGMGVKVSEKAESCWGGDIIHSFIMDIPANFSQAQREQAEECFKKLSANHKIYHNSSLEFDITLTGLGGTVLLAPIIMHIIEYCQKEGTNNNF